MSTRTGFVWHERLMWHDTGSGAAFVSAGGDVEPDVFVENHRSKRRLRNLVEASGLLEHLVAVRAVAATDEQVARFHTDEYIARLRALNADRGGDAGELVPFGPGGYDLAQLSAGGCIAAVDAVMDGAVDNAYALVRPPGHHAETDRGRGFCLLNNVVLAARHAQATRTVGRIAIVDLDAHHGNGTEQAFWTDPDVLVISIHQASVFPPGSGSVDARGAGEGVGYNINVPLPAGSGVGAYELAFERVVDPALRAFGPELILVPFGFDASMLDPLARLMLHSEAYRDLTSRLVHLAGELCAGRLVCCHEGGYSDAYVPFCGLATIEALSARRTAVVDPFLEAFQAEPGQRVQPHQVQAIAKAADRASELVSGVRG